MHFDFLVQARGGRAISNGKRTTNLQTSHRGSPRFLARLCGSLTFILSSKPHCNLNYVDFFFNPFFLIVLSNGPIASSSQWK